jgi:hypothetical protein
MPVIACRPRSGRTIHAAHPDGSITRCGVRLGTIANKLRIRGYVNSRDLCPRCFGFQPGEAQLFVYGLKLKPEPAGR